METQGSYRCTSSCTIRHVSTVLTHVQQVTNGCSCPWTPRESQCDLNPRKDRASSPVKLLRAAPINTDVHPVYFSRLLLLLLTNSKGVWEEEAVSKVRGKRPGCRARGGRRGRPPHEGHAVWFLGRAARGTATGRCPPAGPPAPAGGASVVGAALPTREGVTGNEN